MTVHLSKYAKRFVVELRCFMSQGKPGAVGHRSTTQRQQSGPKPGPRSEPTRTKRPRTERQDDVGASFHFFHCVFFLLVLHLIMIIIIMIMKDEFLGRGADTCPRGGLETRLMDS